MLYRLYSNVDNMFIPDIAFNMYLKHREGFDEVVKMNFTPPNDDAYYYFE